MDLAILGFYGVVAGVLAGVFGIGGGTVIVPAMIFFGFDIKNAIGISVMQMIFSSIYGSFLNFRARILEVKIAIFVALGGLCGASFSGFVVKNLQPIYLEIAFILVCVYSILKVFKKPHDERLAGELAAKSSHKNAILFLVGFATGIFAISLGIGGGLIIVPAVSYYLGLPTKKVVPISLFFVIFSSFSGFWSLAVQDLVNYKEGLIVGIFSLIGVNLGIKINKKISNKAHKFAVIALYLVVLAVMIRGIVARL